MLGLLTYPVLVEPALAVGAQAGLWSGGYALFVLACLGSAWLGWKASGSALRAGAPGTSVDDDSPRPSAAECLLWIGLSATASILLLALTRHLTQDVAPVPFLWVLPLAIYLLRNYMVGLPRDIIECAKVDGASDFQIFTKIVLPLSFPALASFAIFQFLWTWNDLLVALVFLGTDDSKLVLTARLVNLLAYAALCYAALRTAHKCKPAFLCIMLLPMSLHDAPERRA